MIPLLQTLCWAAVAALFVARLDRFAHAWLDRAKGPASEPEAPVVIPDDLIAVAMQESETWAQEDRLKVIREKYATLGDWNRVRKAVGVGQMEGDG